MFKRQIFSIIIHRETMINDQCGDPAHTCLLTLSKKRQLLGDFAYELLYAHYLSEEDKKNYLQQFKARLNSCVPLEYLLNFMRKVHSAHQARRRTSLKSVDIKKPTKSLNSLKKCERDGRAMSKPHFQADSRKTNPYISSIAKSSKSARFKNSRLDPITALANMSSIKKERGQQKISNNNMSYDYFIGNSRRSEDDGKFQTSSDPHKIKDFYKQLRLLLEQSSSKSPSNYAFMEGTNTIDSSRFERKKTKYNPFRQYLNQERQAELLQESRKRIWNESQRIQYGEDSEYNQFRRDQDFIEVLLEERKAIDELCKQAIQERSIHILPSDAYSLCIIKKQEMQRHHQLYQSLESELFRKYIGFTKKQEQIFVQKHQRQGQITMKMKNKQENLLEYLGKIKVELNQYYEESKISKYQSDRAWCKKVDDYIRFIAQKYQHIDNLNKT